jgi:zinc protease
VFRKIFFIAFIFSMSLARAEAPLNIDLKVEKFELENGMKVLLQVDRRIPMVSVNQWYDVGSYHEERNRTGLAHFFEHLMFKGTKKFPDGKFDELVSKVGGQNNAFTSRDYTGYYETVPASSLEQVLELEADRMTNLSLTLPQIQKEREVVKEERRMRTENTPSGYIFEVMMEKVFNDHPYASSVIGSMDHLNKTELNDFMDFYKKFYAPNNSILVLVGDFDANKAKKWIHKYYSKIPRSKIADVKAPPFKLTTKNTFLRENKRFDNRKLAIYFYAPAYGTKESFALDVICEILAGDESSPLTKSLVEDQKIATAVSFWNYSMKYAGAVSFNADIIGNKSFDTVEKIFFDTLTNLIKNGVSEEQLQKSKDKISLDYVSSLRTLTGKARVLAQSEIIKGDYKAFFGDLAVYQSINKQDIIDVAKKYLNKNQSHILHLGK